LGISKVCEELSMTELQSRLLEMLKWFDEYCRANNLRYYVLGGTMLGAVRHKGFIPWDDDIDVGLPRRDYEKLAKLMKSKTGKYVLETPYTSESAFCYPYSKLYDTTTTLIENTREKLIRGIYLDVFPLDGIGNSKEEVHKNFLPIKILENFYLSRVCGIRKGRIWWKNLAAYIIGGIPDTIINNRKLRLKLDKLCRKFDYDKCRWVGNLMGNWLEKETVPKEVMGKPTEYDFENIKVYGAEHFDAYLKSLYGNWRQLPPKEKRITHHDFSYVNLHKSYIDFNP